MKNLVNTVRLLFFLLFLFLMASGKIMMWLAVFVVSLFVALIFGRVYCGYVCPMNTLMIPVDLISKKLKLQTQATPNWLKNGYLGLVAFIVTIAGVFISKRLLHINFLILPFWLLMSVLVTLRFRPAVFHNYICPFGLLQKFFGRHARLATRVNSDTCVGCKLCEKACPSDAIAVLMKNEKALINTSLCYQCTSCQQVCPKASIHYSK